MRYRDKLHLNHDNAAFDYVEEHIKYASNFDNMIKREILKINVTKLYELQEISDTLYGILQWLMLIFILLSIILYKIW